MRTVLVLSLPVILIGGSTLAGVLLGAWLFRVGIRQGLALRFRGTAKASEAAPRVEIPDAGPETGSGKI